MICSKNVTLNLDWQPAYKVKKKILATKNFIKDKMFKCPSAF